MHNKLRPMKKYIVTKKCYANEFVLVEAESEEEAIAKASRNDCKSLGNNLEFNGYQPTRKWQAEELEPNKNTKVIT